MSDSVRPYRWKPTRLPNSCCCCCCYVASVVSDSVRPHKRQPTRLPQSLGFSWQEHWSGLPFPSPMRESEVTQSCPTLCNPMDCSLPGSSVHGIFQARVLEWVSSAFSALIAQLVKNPPVIQETPVRFLGRVDPVPTIWFLLQNLLGILPPTSVVFLE